MKGKKKYPKQFCSFCGQDVEVREQYDMPICDPVSAVTTAAIYRVTVTTKKASWLRPVLWS